MKVRKAVLLAVGLMVVGAQAVSITHSNTTINMEFVDIGHAGHVADSTGYGAVNHNYRIGKLEVTIATFEAVRAADNRIGDGDEGYWNDGTRTVGAGGPASYVSWYEAAKFCNWLTTGDAYTGAYQFGGSGAFVSINRDAAITAYGIAYMMPTLDEWYKAAYFKPDSSGYSLYANGSDDIADLTHGTASGWNYDNVNPSPNYTWETGFGAEEQNGTCDMMGNVREWTENEILGPIGTIRELGGGDFSSGWPTLGSSSQYDSNNPITPSDESASFGFRVAAIPEPSTLATMIVGGGILYLGHKKRR